VGQRTVNRQLKRWFLDLDLPDTHLNAHRLEGESQDDLLAASIAAAAVLAAFVILMVVVTILFAGRLVVAWFAQS
jgi:hypothetical protein